ncbi:hypothetical protein ACRRTK_021431 [Alexandromys fortis]
MGAQAPLRLPAAPPLAVCGYTSVLLLFAFCLPGSRASNQPAGGGGDCPGGRGKSINCSVQWVLYAQYHRYRLSKSTSITWERKLDHTVRYEPPVPLTLTSPSQLQRNELNVRESDVRACDESSCKYGGVCKEDGDGLKCACQFQCHTNYIPVCGSNGDTYQNECFLRRAACKHQKDITVVARGPCYSDNGSGSGEGEEEGSGAEAPRKHSKCGPCKYKAECDEDAENVGLLSVAYGYRRQCVLSVNSTDVCVAASSTGNKTHVNSI